MIVYNHDIKFIPELKNDKKLQGSLLDVITVKESSCPDLHEKLFHEMKFFNNQGRELSLHTDRKFASTSMGQLWAFEVKDVLTFFWHSGTVTIKYIPQKNFSEELLRYWSLHIILPIFFTIEESYDFLHAGAVEVEGKPILFVAESHGGKSTMTDFFMEQGHTMISDDKVAVHEENGSFFALPSHPHHRPYRKMEDLGYFVENFTAGPKPVHAIYELEKAEPDANISIVELQGAEKFKSLHYASLLNLFFLKPQRFSFLMQVAKSVPWDLGRLGEVHQRIVEHTKGKSL